VVVSLGRRAWASACDEANAWIKICGGEIQREVETNRRPLLSFNSIHSFPSLSRYPCCLLFAFNTPIAATNPKANEWRDVSIPSACIISSTLLGGTLEKVRGRDGGGKGEEG
jgi:hypothetical protein